MNIYDRFSWLIWARYLQIDQGSINQHVSNGKGETLELGRIGIF